MKQCLVDAFLNKCLSRQVWLVFQKAEAKRGLLWKCDIYFFFWTLEVAYLWTLECVFCGGQELTKFCGSIVSVCVRRWLWIWTCVSSTWCYCLYMCVCVCVGGRERGASMSMTQSNLHWFPLHVWWCTQRFLSFCCFASLPDTNEHSVVSSVINLPKTNIWSFILLAEHTDRFSWSLIFGQIEFIWLIELFFYLVCTFAIVL